MVDSASPRREVSAKSAGLAASVHLTGLATSVHLTGLATSVHLTARVRDGNQSDNPICTQPSPLIRGRMTDVDRACHQRGLPPAAGQSASVCWSGSDRALACTVTGAVGVWEYGSGVRINSSAPRASDNSSCGERPSPTQTAAAKETNMASRLIPLAALMATCCQAKATTSHPIKAPWEAPCRGQGAGRGTPRTPLAQLQRLSKQALELTGALRNHTKTLDQWMTSVHFDNFPVTRATMSTAEKKLKSDVKAGHYGALSSLSPFLELLVEQSPVCSKMAAQCQQLQTTVLDWMCELSLGLDAVPSPASRTIVSDKLRSMCVCDVRDVRDAIILKDILALVQAFHSQYDLRVLV